MTAGRVHNTTPGRLRIGGHTLEPGGAVDVDDLEELGELPRGAYVKQVAAVADAEDTTAAGIIAAIPNLPADELTELLEREQASAKPRTTVVAALEARLAELDAATTDPELEEPAAP